MGSFPSISTKCRPLVPARIAEKDQHFQQPHLCKAPTVDGQPQPPEVGHVLHNDCSQPADLPFQQRVRLLPSCFRDPQVLLLPVFGAKKKRKVDLRL